MKKLCLPLFVVAALVVGATAVKAEEPKAPPSGAKLADAASAKRDLLLQDTVENADAADGTIYVRGRILAAVFGGGGCSKGGGYGRCGKSGGQQQCQTGTCGQTTQAQNVVSYTPSGAGSSGQAVQYYYSCNGRTCELVSYASPGTTTYSPVTSTGGGAPSSVIMGTSSGSACRLVKVWDAKSGSFYYVQKCPN